MPFGQGRAWMATGLPGLGAVGRVVGPAEDPRKRDLYLYGQVY
jgi:hypothetical protein